MTSGSYYWHFNNRRERYDPPLDYRERKMAKTAIETAKLVESPQPAGVQLQTMRFLSRLRGAAHVLECPLMPLAAIAIEFGPGAAVNRHANLLSFGNTIA